MTRKRCTLGAAAAALTFALLAAPPAGADLTAGIAAYDAGDYQGAFRQWLEAAEAGDIAAQRNVGHLYRWGKGTERDAAKAAYWYRRSAEAGLQGAQLNLALLYLTGEGVPQDLAEAARWFEKAAEQEDPVAQYELARLVERGRGVPIDAERARHLYQLAADAGLQQARQRLSELDQESGRVSVRSAADEGRMVVAALPPVAEDPPRPAPLAAEVSARPSAPESGEAEPIREAKSDMAPEPAALEPESTEAASPEPETTEASASASPPDPTPPAEEPAEPEPSEPEPVSPKAPAAGVGGGVEPAGEVEEGEASRPVEASGLVAHLASYRSRARAESGWKLLARKHAALALLRPAIVVTEIAEKGTFFRLYALGDRPGVEQACRALRDASVYCALKRLPGKR